MGSWYNPAVIKADGSQIVRRSFSFTLSVLVYRKHILVTAM